MSRMKVVGLVTTYNEEQTIGSLVAGLLEVCDRVLVVDDPASTDNTERVAHAFGANTLLDTNARGIGPCLLAGMSMLRGEWVVVVDAGGSHDPSAILSMCQYSADVVIGSRFCTGATYIGRPGRKRLSRAYTIACNRRTGQSISDWTSGFRLYSPKAVRAILARKPSATMHGFQPQALAACVRDGCKVAEHPIRYTAGRSSMNRKVAWEAVRALGGL